MKKIILGLSILMVCLTTSCSDFFEMDSTHYIPANENHLKTPTDTIYSVIGILTKVQAIGDRTILLGEMRGDLTSVTKTTSADLRKVAMFNIDDDNIYNNPRDYYAIINNCNYFIAHADTAMKNNRNEEIFMREYAAVKAIRAWTYLQLVTTYGRVPFVLDPIMTDAEAQLDYPMYDIQQVCDYFINQDGLYELAEKGYPAYGDIHYIPSRLFYFPIYLVLGDMNLWSGRYWDAAVCYHAYIATRNGANSAYPIYANRAQWANTDYDPTTDISCSAYRSLFQQEAASASAELITIIPSDSLKSDPHYSQLRNIFFSRTENNFEVSAVPSQALIQLSANQDYWDYDSRTRSFNKGPKNLGNYADGDLRLFANIRRYDDMTYNGKTIENMVYNYKYVSPNIHIYRRAMVYLRMAEALNRAGYPLFAFKILETGVDDDVLKDIICKEYRADSTLLINTMNFPTSRYLVADPFSLQGDAMNTVGIHWKGCGFPMGDTLVYVMPYNNEIAAGPDSAATQLKYQIDKVEEMIVDEMALELAFEGTRFYDLMRVSMHRNDPSFLAKKVNARNGEGTDAGIEVNLENPMNWYLRWQGKIGY